MQKNSKKLHKQTQKLIQLRHTVTFKATWNPKIESRTNQNRKLKSKNQKTNYSHISNIYTKETND